jgi:hypothetical protein
VIWTCGRASFEGTNEVRESAGKLEGRLAEEDMARTRVVEGTATEVV